VILQSVFQKSLDFFGSKPVVVEAADISLTSDAGLVPIRQLDEVWGLSEQFAAALTDTRRQASVGHSFLQMVRSRVYGILADYPDQNDHDALRSDPVFKLIADRSPDDERDLACQSTHSRFENAIDVPSLFRLRNVFIEQFIASFDEPPAEITLDLDAFDDPAHGQQQLVLFHGYYGQYQYLPVAWTCAENDMVVMCSLLFGTAPAGLGAEDDLELLTTRLREVWPDVRILFRGDSGIGKPALYERCEALRVEYSLGIGMNAVLKQQSETLLEQAIEQFEQTGQKQRLFTAFDYQAGSWNVPRWTIIKVEVTAAGTNRRAILTNRPGGRVVPAGAYDAYADRGESENRNKELKCGLHADRLSDHRYMANLFRLYLHCAAHNLQVRVRRLIADPLPEHPHEPEGLPSEALPEDRKRHRHNRRRKRDPLGEGQPCTWRTRLIKVAAEIRVSARRILVRLPAHWPYLHHFEHLAAAAMTLTLAARPPT
jgi:Transposase DDE domain group 1